MIRIIHLSDFHLNKKFLRDWRNYVKKALIQKLKQANQIHPINFVAFTGDLIDMGGYDFGSPKEAFKAFQDEVIQPMIEELCLERQEFLFIPGNHDVVRSLDSKREELGNVTYFNEAYENISEYMDAAITASDYSGMKRMEPYKQFEAEFYKGIPNSDLTMFGSSFIVKNGGNEIGVACLNSAWRCYGKDDQNRVIVGEDQLAKSLDFISNCKIKVALLHHPLDWLLPAERDTIANHLTKDFDLLLLGHVHQNKTSMAIGFTGTLFTNVAPSGLNDIRSDSRQFSNGFTIIDFDKKHGKVEAQYWRYNHDHKNYVLNTDLIESGTYIGQVPPQQTKKTQSLENTLLNNIREDHFKKIDEHLIDSKVKEQAVSIKDVFVMPPINQGVANDEEEGDVDLQISDIVKSKSNFIFFGQHECGKTTLLYRLVKEYVDEFSILRKIPVYFDYEEMGNKEIITIIKDYLRCNTQEAKSLIDSNSIVLLIDNFNHRDKFRIEQRNKVHAFNREHEETQIMATAEGFTAGVTPAEFIAQNKIPFRNYFIKNLRAKEIKCIIKQWMPNENELSSDHRLEKLVDTFRSYALPSSVMSVSLFLWSTEYSDRKPINNAVLLEIYIDILLEKLGKHNVYRENFDFTNKIQLLAHVAEAMLPEEKENYSIPLSTFLKKVEDYLREVGFDFDAKIIVDYFLERKIFIQVPGSRIKFAYSCFLYFFIAKRMMFNKDFKDFILHDDRFYKYTKEIDYYSGLVRNDEALLELTLKRLKEGFQTWDQILNQIDIDDHFTTKVTERKDEKLGQDLDKLKHKPLIEDIEIEKIKNGRPTENQIEELHNQRLKEIPKSDEILKREGSRSLEGLLITSANVLRNSEGVENRKLKEVAYSMQVKYSIIWMILYKAYLIDYFDKRNELPPRMRSFAQYVNMIRHLPVAVQGGMKIHMGTSKLAPIILDKIKEDMHKKAISDVEVFLSVALYSDIEGQNFPTYLKQMVKRVGRNGVQDFLFLKLANYYYRRTRPGSSNEQMYLDLLADLRLKTKRLPARLKNEVIKTLQQAKKALG